MIVINRLRYDPQVAPTPNAALRKDSKPEIIRCLKHYVAREIYNVLIRFRSAEKPVLSTCRCRGASSVQRRTHRALFPRLVSGPDHTRGGAPSRARPTPRPWSFLPG